MRKLISTILIGGVCFFSAVACQDGADERSSSLNDASGICFRRLKEMKDGKLTSNYEIVVVQRSSNSLKDEERVEALKAGGSQLYFSHLSENTWHSAWISDGMSDFTSGPSCSSLSENYNHREH